MRSIASSERPASALLRTARSSIRSMVRARHVQLALCRARANQGQQHRRSVADGDRRAVQLAEGDADLFVVAVGLVLEVFEGDLFAEDDGPVGVATPVDAGVDAVAKADVVGELVEFAVDSHPRFVGGVIRDEGEAVE